MQRIQREVWIESALEEISKLKTEEWKIEVKFSYAYQYLIKDEFKQLNTFFQAYGFKVVPYHLEGFHLPQRKASFGLFYNGTPRVLYVNTACFKDDYLKSEMNSALNVAFHEFLHSISFIDSLKYDILIACIENVDFVNYIMKNDINQKVVHIYGDDSGILRNEYTLRNEFIHRYIANNLDTTPLLKALFTNDTTFKPAKHHKALYNQLQNILNELKVS